MSFSSRALSDELTASLSAVYPRRTARQLALRLLEHRAKLPSPQVLADRPCPVPEATLRPQLTEDVARLLRHEPWQYVVGEASFCGASLLVSPAVLIPRPETEELTHQLIEAYRPDRRKTPRLRVLDVGTGSGCVAVTVARELPHAEVFGLDVSAEALRVAACNAQRQRVAVTWLKADILKISPTCLPQALDLIVSNPPYVRHAERATMQTNVLDYEPHTALFVDDDRPLVFYEAIARLAQQCLQPGGALHFEVNECYGEEVASLLAEQDFADVRLQEDLSGRPRFVSARWE